MPEAVLEDSLRGGSSERSGVAANEMEGNGASEPDRGFFRIDGPGFESSEGCRGSRGVESALPVTFVGEISKEALASGEVGVGVAWQYQDYAGSTTQSFDLPRCKGRVSSPWEWGRALCGSEFLPRKGL